MKRTDIIKLLVKEGLSEKTLANFSDKQIFDLSKRMLDEALTATMADIKKSPVLQAAAKDPNQKIQVVGETKKGSSEKKKPLSKTQSDKMDQDKDGDIDSKDLKILRNKKQHASKSEPKEDSWDSKSVQKAFKRVSGSQKRISPPSSRFDMIGGVESDRYDGKIPKFSDKVYDELYRSVYNPETRELELPKEIDETKKSPSSGLSKEKKSEVVKKAKKGEDIGKPGKGFEKIEKKAKESGAKNPKAVAAAAMWKNIKRESVVKEQDEFSINPENNYEIVVISKTPNSEKLNKERFYFNTDSKEKAKMYAEKIWHNVNDDDESSIVEILTDEEYREKYLRKESNDVLNWVDGLVESNYHPFTSKGEILNLIKEKLNSK